MGEDTPLSSVLLDLLVQLSAKPAFQALRTQQRLGYAVTLEHFKLHQTLGLKVGWRRAWGRGGGEGRAEGGGGGEEG